MRAQPILTAEQADAVKEIRGLQITTDASGGYLMPFTLDPTIILTNNGVVNPIRQLATVNSVATDNWQGITSAGVTASYDAEESEVSDDTRRWLSRRSPSTRGRRSSRSRCRPKTTSRRCRPISPTRSPTPKTGWN